MATYQTFTFAADNVEFVEKQVARLAKRASKLGQVAIEFEYGSPIAISDTQFVRVGVISGPAPKVNGFTIIAKIEDDSEIGRVINVAPGCEDSLVEYRDAKLTCDHCAKKRTRKTHFVVENEAGERRVIGRTCIVDYIGSEDVLNRIKLWKLIGEASEEKMSGGRGGDTVKVLTWVKYATADTMDRGYRKADSEYPTRSACSASVYPFNRFDREVKERLDGIEGAEERAQAAIDWAASLTDEELGSNYMWTLHRIAKAEFVTPKTFGYAASLYQAYLRATEQLEKKQAREKEAAKQVCFDGVEGSRVKGREFKVQRVRGCDGYYGESTIVCLLNEATGEHLTWFASGYKSEWYDAEGDVVTIDFTIKGHDVGGKYGDTTKVNRVKMIGEPVAA